MAGVRVDAQRPGPHHRAGPLISRRANSRRSPWTILAVATLAQATSGYVVLGVATLASFAADDFGLGGTATGLIVTAAGLAPLFALVPVGRLLDVHGERRVVTAGGLWLGLGGLVSAFAPSYPLLLAALLLGGVGYATAQPGGSKAVAGWFPDRRGLAMGIRQTGLPLGGALAAATLPALATSWGWRSALGVAGAVGIAGAVAFGLVYDDPEAGDDDVESYEFGPQLRRLLRMPSVRAAAAAGFVMVSAQFCLVSYLLPFLRSETGIAPERGAVALFAVQGCGIAGRIVLAAWSDRTAHRLIPVATAAIAAAIAVAALPPAAGRLELPLLVTYAGVLGFFAFGWYGPWVVHVAELAPGRSVGLTLTVAMTANQLGIAAGPPLFGLALDLGGYSVAWGILAAGLLLISVTTFRRARWAEVSR